MSNTSPDAIPIITGRLDTTNPSIFSSELCSNSSAIDILLANKDKINWFGYSANTNNTINNEAIAILKEKIKKDVNGNIINWNLLSANTSIFKAGLG
jgi:transaldolase